MHIGRSRFAAWPPQMWSRYHISVVIGCSRFEAYPHFYFDTSTPAAPFTLRVSCEFAWFQKRSRSCWGYIFPYAGVCWSMSSASVFAARNRGNLRVSVTLKFAVQPHSLTQSFLITITLYISTLLQALQNQATHTFSSLLPSYSHWISINELIPHSNGHAEMWRPLFFLSLATYPAYFFLFLSSPLRMVLVSGFANIGVGLCSLI